MHWGLSEAGNLGLNSTVWFMYTIKKENIYNRWYNSNSQASYVVYKKRWKNNIYDKEYNKLAIN